MARRRNLAVPSSDELQKLEAEFRRETLNTPFGAPAPIAQVVAEAAQSYDPRPTPQRAEAARDRADAEALRQATQKGLILREIGLDQIDADALVRDRVVIGAEELEELKSSIARNGLRLPIEVFAQPGNGAPFGLLSGYRRLKAVRELRALSGDPKYDHIKAVLRDPEAMGGAFAAMVEENEIRASLSHFERGRIAVIAAQQGAFANTEAAVEALFPVASKAKRSKIRSFALIFEELGDMLRFPDFLREKEGLKLASALREGGEARLREALAMGEPQTPDAESALIEAALHEVSPPLPDAKKGGRPKRASLPDMALSSGYTLRAQEEGQGWAIHLGGRRKVDRELVEAVMREIAHLLDKP